MATQRDNQKSIVFKDVNPDVIIESPFELVYNDDALQKSIVAILSTPVGSRPFRRDFGSRVTGLLFDPIDQITASTLASEIDYALSTWEKRISNLKVEVLPDRDTQAFYVSITYTVPSLGNNVQNFKFNLIAGSGGN